MKKPAIFNLEGPVAESQSPLDTERSKRCGVLPGIVKTPVISDYPAKAGVVSIQVRDPNETKRVIKAIIACLRGVETSFENQK